MKEEKISYYEIFYTFIFGCVFGWIVEGIWSLLKKNLLINHSALVIGPFNIVYGIGAIVLSIILYRVKDSSLKKIFIISFFTGTVLEYILSFMMEKLVGFVAWNYSKKPFNINGRVCLLYSLFWGVLGIVWIKLIYPPLKGFIDRSNKVIGNRILKFLSIFLLFDVLLTFAAIERGKEFEQNIPPSNKIEVYIDKYFGVDYLNNMFNYRWNRK